MKHALPAIALLLLFAVPPGLATTGAYISPPAVSLSGPLVDSVAFSVCPDEATCSSLLLSGSIQAAEWDFSIGGWTSLCPSPMGTGGNPSVLCGTTPQYTYVYLGFNYVKFPGDNVQFRRAMQFLQDYSYTESTVLQGTMGTTADTPLPCFAYPEACEPGAMTSHYGTTQNLEAAGEELELVDDGTPQTTLFCDNGGSPCAGAYTPDSEWCTVALGGGDGACDKNGAEPFTVNLFYRTLDSEDRWASAIIGWASQIGLSIIAHPLGTFSAFASACEIPNSREVVTSGVYDPATGYNSDPSFDANAIAADSCDMLIFHGGNPNPWPDQWYGLEQYNSAWGLGLSLVHDDPAYVTAADSLAGYPSPIQHTTLFNLDYATNAVIYASSARGAAAAAQGFLGAYALQVPTVVGYFLNRLYADNANGWTSFAQEPDTGPNELQGLSYTLMNVHQCGQSTCDLGAPGGGTLGGTFGYALEEPLGQGDLNPVFSGFGVPAEDVWGNVFDTPLLVAPNDFGVVGTYSDYMTSSHTVAPLPGQTVTGTGGTWFYFQQQCAGWLPAATYTARLARCIGHSGPNQAPGPLQRGIGLAAAQRTISYGEEVSLTFKKGIYFSDGIQVFANDYLFSLNLFNVAGASEERGFATSEGLIAAHLLSAKGLPCSIDCPTIDLYFSGQNYLGTSPDLGTIVVPVLPAHIWKYFNPVQMAYWGDAPSAVDTSQPYDLAATAFSTAGAPQPPPGSWIHYLNNLEIGSGPFWLESWDNSSQTGEIDANPFYFNANWTAMADVNAVSGTEYTLTATLEIPIFNPTAAPITCGPVQPGPILPGTTGICQITDAAPGANKLKVYDSAGDLLRSLPLREDSTTGQYYGTIPFGLSYAGGKPCRMPVPYCSSMPPGKYYALIQTTYPFHGQTRTWYQTFGFTVQ